MALTDQVLDGGFPFSKGVSMVDPYRALYGPEWDKRSRSNPPPSIPLVMPQSAPASNAALVQRIDALEVEIALLSETVQAGNEKLDALLSVIGSLADGAFVINRNDEDIPF